jgi:hypothetical protein
MSDERLRALAKRCIEYVEDAAEYHELMSNTYGRKNFEHHDEQSAGAKALAKELQAYFDEATVNGSLTPLDDYIAEFKKCALQNQPDELPDNGEPSQ